jgi:WXG100 protein secretion system (Wss), protein YukD
VTVVLVTVAGPSGRRDLVVPADVPVGDLLGPVAAALPGGDPAVVDGQPGMAGRARWRLGPLGGDPLPPERSLATCGIGDGATLTLTPDPPPATGHPPLAGSTPLASRGAAALAAGAETPLAARGGAIPLASRGGAAGGRSLVGWWGRGSRAREGGEELLEAAIAAPRLRRCAVVGVVSADAGIGRTTVAALLASVLAATRGGLTVAVDVHPGPGSLADRLAPGQDVPAGDLLGLLDHPALTGGELLACLAGRRPGGAGSRSASPAVAGVGGSPAPDRRAWTLLVRGLARHANALVLDCGPGLGDPAAQAAVATADQFVLVTEPAPSPGSRRVAGALADLGHAVVVVLAGGSGSRSASPAALARLLPGVRGVVPLPPPPAVPPRGWAEVPPWWRRPARQLASLLAADWPALGMTAAGG